MPDLSQLQSTMGYTFKRVFLLETAMTHASYSVHNNQRMEYLGDALLGFVVSELLFKQHAAASEGLLTRLRAHLVCKKSLVHLAKSLEFSRFLKVGKSLDAVDEPTDSMLADAFEAVVAAIYLDADQATVIQFVEGCYQRFMGKDYAALVQKDPKSQLQEFCQKHQYALPHYQVSEDAQADQRFAVDVSIQGLALRATSRAVSKREAQRMAAAQLLDQLQQKGLWSNGQ